MDQATRRIVTGAALDEDARIDASVRPKRFADLGSPGTELEFAL